MLDGGPTADHPNGLLFDDVATGVQVNEPTKYTIAVKLRPYLAGTGGNRVILGNFDPTSGNREGWSLVYRSPTGATNACQMWHGSGGATQTRDDQMTTELAVDTTISLIVTWDGSTISWYVNGAGAGSGSFSAVVADDSFDLKIFQYEVASKGFAGTIGHPMFWRFVLDSDERALYDGGIDVPRPADLGFWHRGIAIPGRDEISDFIGSLIGTDLKLFGDPVDDYFSGVSVLHPVKELGGRNLRIYQHGADVYSLKVPHEFLQLELMDEIQMALTSLPRSATLLDSVEENFLIEPWRRMYGQVVGMVLNPDDHTLDLTVLNLEPAICFFFSTGATPFDVNNEGEGQADWNIGGTKTIVRNSTAYLIDAAEKQGIVQLAPISPTREKRNHRGTLCEDSVQNEILNSFFKDDTAGAPDGWTVVTGTGGTVAISTDEQFYENAASNGAQVVKVNKGSSGTVYYERSWTVTDVSRRLTIDTKDGNVAGEWAFQRPTSSDWWDDVNETWSNTIVWNAISSSSSTAWKSTISKVITSPGAGTATLRVGINTGSENDNFYVGDHLEVADTLIYSNIPTDNSAAVTSATDILHWEIDNGGTDSRQVYHPERGTYRVTMRAVQDGADAVEEGTANRHIIALWRWNDDDERDELSLEKVSGQVRISARRFIGGVEKAVAFANITLVQDQEYEIRYVWTSPSDGELNLPARTLRVSVDGVNGTDDTADGVHSTSTQITQFYLGSAPASLSLKAAMNFLRNWETVQWCISDEEALARRP